MEETKPFYDFCIPYTSNTTVLRKILDELVEDGYRTIAIEQIYDHTDKVAKKKSGTEIFPMPVDIAELKAAYDGKLKMLQRLTIIYADAGIAHPMLTSLNLKRFNLLAGQPKTDAALKHCCLSFNGDIITFGPEAGLRLQVGYKDYKIAVKRGVFFELKYALPIADSNVLRDMIKLANNYAFRGKARNVIFSSGATNEFQLRAPNDVANLAYVFGMPADQGKNAIDRSARELYLRAESRRLGKTIMFVKSSGPLVFPPSSDEEADSMDEELSGAEDDSLLEDILEIGAGRDATEVANGNGHYAEAEDEDDAAVEVPSKKLKIHT